MNHDATPLNIGRRRNATPPRCGEGCGDTLDEPIFFKEGSIQGQKAPVFVRSAAANEDRDAVAFLWAKAGWCCDRASAPNFESVNPFRLLDLAELFWRLKTLGTMNSALRKLPR